ncbi:hypothetical protein ACMFMG_000293 [Clarireedia jacksonii]
MKHLSGGAKRHHRRRCEDLESKLCCDRDASTPFNQFQAQVEEEKHRIMEIQEDEKSVSRTKIDSGQLPSGTSKDYLDYEKQAVETIRDHWIKQGIWDDKWTKDLYFIKAKWKHEEPLKSPLEFHTSADEKSGCFTNLFHRSKPQAKESTRDQKISRDREASRPSAQFSYQIALEKHRILVQGRNSVMLSHSEVYKIAFEKAKTTWVNRGIWNEAWGDWPGPCWKHEEPYTEDLVDYVSDTAVHNYYYPPTMSGIPRAPADMRRLTEPGRQFEDQCAEEEMRLRDEICRGGPYHDIKYDLKESARNTVRARWIKQGIWINEWDGCSTEKWNMWGHEFPQPAPGHNTNHSRQASRPCHQFFYQVIAERARINGLNENLAGPKGEEFQAPMSVAEVNKAAYINTKNLWLRRGIWDRTWVDPLPGLAWEHEFPVESRAAQATFLTELSRDINMDEIRDYYAQPQSNKNVSVGTQTSIESEEPAELADSPGALSFKENYWGGQIN